MMNLLLTQEQVEKLAETFLGRTCGCVGLYTYWVQHFLPYAKQEQHYKKRVNDANPVAWEQCRICDGTGVDRRP